VVIVVVIPGSNREERETSGMMKELEMKTVKALMEADLVVMMNITKMTGAQKVAMEQMTGEMTIRVQEVMAKVLVLEAQEVKMNGAMRATNGEKVAMTAEEVQVMVVRGVLEKMNGVMKVAGEMKRTGVMKVILEMMRDLDQEDLVDLVDQADKADQVDQGQKVRKIMVNWVHQEMSHLETSFLKKVKVKGKEMVQIQLMMETEVLRSNKPTNLLTSKNKA
jgi:hypothetical protein